eukprot:gene15167-33867_t
MFSMFSWLRITVAFVVVFASLAVAEPRQRSWDVKRGWGGPGPNVWSDDPAAVFVDNVTGALHLKASATTSRKSNARVFNCTEVSLPTPLGFGTYEWDVVGDASALGNADPHVVLGMFLYQND